MESITTQPVAIITGAGRGIGQATTRRLAHKGYRLTLTARNEDQLRDSARTLGANVQIIAGDVSDPAHAQRLIDATIQQFGRVDAVVNNAGHAPLATMDQITLDQWQRILDVNLSAVFYICKAAWPVMKRQGAGVIVNVSSESARDPFEGLFAYGAAKAGVNLLGHALARQGQPFGIRVHTIAPGAVETAMLRALVTPEQLPADKTLDPDQVAGAIVSCIDGDLRHTSGEVIYVHKAL